MICIVLAAGMARRLRPYTTDCPQVLLELEENVTLLDAQLDVFTKVKEIDRVVYVTGYQSKSIDTKLKAVDLEYSVNVSSVFNPAYDCCDNLISLMLCRKYFRNEMVIMNGDNLVSSHALSCICSGTKNGMSLMVENTMEYKDGDMGVIIDNENNVVNIRKGLVPSDVSALSAGILVVRGAEAKQQISDAVSDLVRLRESCKMHWPEILNKIIEKGYSIQARSCFQQKWFQEIDSHEDLADAIRFYDTIVHAQKDCEICQRCGL